MKFFDSHSHYYDERFAEEYPGGAPALLDGLFDSTVSGIINVATSPKNCLLAIEQAKKYKNMYTALGIHPTDATYLSLRPEDAVDAVRKLILDKQNKCVAVGEIGLDYHYPDTDKKLQLEYFDMQLSLARELSLPVSIHDRDSHADVLEMLKRYPDVRGVLHSFSGSVEMARELIRLGYMISFSGVLTFTNARRSREVAQILPHECVMIETDCPYLAPHPNRGKLNHSGYLEYTNRTLAEIFGIDEAECAALTEANAKGFFCID